MKFDTSSSNPGIVRDPNLFSTEPSVPWTAAMASALISSLHFNRSAVSPPPFLMFMYNCFFAWLSLCTFSHVLAPSIGIFPLYGPVGH